MRNIINKLLIILSIFCITFSCLNTKNVFVDASTQSEIVIEVNSKRILHQVNAFDKKFMASTTKILTAIVIIENCNLAETITITKDTIGIEGSSIYLEEGEKLTIKDLLYGLMLRSGNDCAETLAKHCSGSIEKFAILMNETAKKIGANNSNFVNPHGLHNDEHYTTAYDLALISAYSIKNPIFKEIVSTKRIKIPQTTRNYDRILINKNKMLNTLDGATGIKTGFTKKAGRCLVTSCFRNGMELVCVVLNCPPMFEKSQSLINNVYENYELTKIIESDNILDFIDINGKKTPIHIKNDIVLPLKPSEKNQLKITYDYPKTIKNETKNDTEIGFVKIYLKNNLLFTEKIYTI